jgi:hypothetical protein
MAVLCNATGLTSPVHAWKEETGSVEQETSGTDGGGGHGGVDGALATVAWAAPGPPTVVKAWR